ncbi:phosphatidylglycerol:prolipoprotein diacylglycerol transferase [Altererythrobacter atlanticus]|uniref:Phosphatidylglycerol--prolipoprotein diacylglyceryl transferase n=1 Tax=Croceibacterium atlanticum TaxID=1267766 RepID=A0A0F7KV83_9SPHN|nr:prolipoprotein diacylglyceryl transferase [Croceibacterium atlanticum]AKH43091.1 Prolipoprotein diacylglyceryl transferase [Croceibacterium atlanticum]MBB5732205.1 phosphatidylglycerol:prolipoprotein diacylglycerol transferase [Croceibacterium atlanticum]
MPDLLSAAASQPIYWADLGLRPGIELGFFTLRFYSLAYLAGILLGYWHLSRMVKAPGSPMAQRHADDLFFYCTLGIILGGRLGYAAFYQPELFTGWTDSETVSWDLLRLWDGGMSFHGGLIGTTLAIAFVSWRGQISFMRVCDYISVNVGFGMLFGRLANFINGELWGRVAGPDVPWAMVFPGAGDVARHPSQLYEALLEGALVIAVMLPLFWMTRARYRPGILVGTFVCVISAGRFTVEFFREPDAQLADFAMRTGLNMGQWLTIPLILCGLALVFWALRRPELASGRAAAGPASTGA